MRNSTRRRIRGAGVGSSKISCTGSSAIPGGISCPNSRETSSSRLAASAVRSRQTKERAIEATRNFITSLRTSIDSLQTEIEGVTNTGRRTTYIKSYKTKVSLLKQNMLGLFALFKNNAGTVSVEHMAELRELKTYVEEKERMYPGRPSVSRSVPHSASRPASRTRRSR